MNRTILVIAVVVAFAACKGSNIASTNADTERKQLACAKVHVDMDQPHIDWFEENPTVLNKSTELIVLPKNYKVYSVDTTKMVAFFNAVKDRKKVATVLPLPKPAECQLFQVKNNVKEGAVVPSGAVFAVGECKEQKAVLSFHHQRLTAHVNWFGLQYEITPVDANQQTYYVVYTKEPPPPKTAAEKKAAEGTYEWIENKPVK